MKLSVKLRSLLVASTLALGTISATTIAPSVASATSPYACTWENHSEFCFQILGRGMTVYAFIGSVHNGTPWYQLYSLRVIGPGGRGVWYVPRFWLAPGVTHYWAIGIWACLVYPGAYSLWNWKMDLLHWWVEP